MSESDKVGKFHFVTDSYTLDFQGKATIPMIGNHLIRAASSHASFRGFGFTDMTEKHTAWVLSRLAIEMKRYPSLDETIILYTWIDDVGKFFTSRCFELANESGENLGFARSIWAAIDMDTRRPTLLDMERLKAYVTGRPCPIEPPAKIPPTDGKTEGIPYEVKYSDLDVNRHFNSIKYMEHFLDMFDLDMYLNHRVARFEIAFLSEGLYGMPLTWHKAETDSNKYYLEVCHEGKAVCRAAVIWK